MLSAHSISSEAALTFFTGEDGKTVLGHRKTGGLAHVGKCHWNGHVLLAQVVNPTAGYFAGDAFSFTVTLEEGARVLLSQPGATRFHTMTGKNIAHIQQAFILKEGATLDLYPDLTIPQRGSSVKQATEVHLHPTSKCCFLETLTPGRVAHRDVMEWNLVENKLSIYRGEKLLTRERMNLQAEENWRLVGRSGLPLHLATFWIQHPEVDNWTELLSTETLKGKASVGVSVLAESFAVIRVYTDSSVLLRNTVDSLRAFLHTLEPEFGTSNALY